jgi:hypothetical protein
MVERLTGIYVGGREKNMLTHGADEIDLVRSRPGRYDGQCYDQIREIY